jgi:hypothetical protein
MPAMPLQLGCVSSDLFPLRGEVVSLTRLGEVSEGRTCAVGNFRT